VWRGDACNEVCNLTYYGIANYVGILANLTEVVTYCLVVMMLVPLTKLQLERR
jgi:hypothetical protein